MSTRRAHDALEVPVTLEYAELQALITLLADVHDGHGANPSVRKAAGGGWGILSRRWALAAGVGAAAHELDESSLLIMQHRHRPWSPWQHQHPSRAAGANSALIRTASAHLQAQAQLTVGSPYDPSRTRWPERELRWRLSDTEIELVMFRRSPSRHEINDIRSGAARFGLLAGEHALVLASRFGDSSWTDAPWQACRQTTVAAGVPVPDDDQQHVLVVVVLVDSDTGIIKATRATFWEPRFANAVRDAVRTQIHNESAEADGAAEINAWRSEYETTDELLRRRHDHPRHLTTASAAEAVQRLPAEHANPRSPNPTGSAMRA